MHTSRPTKMHYRKPKLKKLHCALMASLVVLIAFSLLLFFSLSSATRHHRKDPNPNPNPNPSLGSIPPEIHQACKATRYPQTCESSLAKVQPDPNPNPNPTRIILSAVSVSADGLKSGQEMVRAILDSAGGNPNRSTAAKSCAEVLRNSAYRTQSAADAFPRGEIRDVRAWMSAALLCQYDCWSTLKYVNDSRQINDTMAYLQSLIDLTSNALSMVMAYEDYGDNVGSWKPPVTERDGFWEGGSGSGDVSGFGIPSGLTAGVTVCKKGGGECNYEKVQEAVDAAPEKLTAGKRFVIGIKEGVYEEIVRVPLEKTNLVFLGDGMGKTVITGSRYSGQPGVTTYTSATVAVLGDGFMASGLTIQNTAGPDVHQAVAFRSESDLSIIENCEFLGNQDTLYAHSLRQFYKSCVIQGNVDFIFGNSASVFQDCTILVRPRQKKPEKGENNAITAHGRTDPAQATGFVFQNCSVNGTEEYVSLYKKNPKVHKNFLGRPWKEYSRVVFIKCNLEAIVSPQGWMPWSGDFALKTLYYGEFENSGAGAGTDGRVPWSSQIPSEHVSSYSVQNFIQGDEWVSKYFS